MKAGATWHDACILNISSRGMLMQAGVPPVRGSYLEIRRGPVVVVARAMWTKQHRFGIKSQDVLSIDSIVCQTPSAAQREDCPTPERRTVGRPSPPTNERSRIQGRTMEYGFAAALAVAAAVFAAGQVYSILARPADAVGTPLAGGEVER